MIVALSIERLQRTLEEVLADDYPPDAIPTIIRRAQELNDEIGKLLEGRTEHLDMGTNERAYEKTAQVMIMTLLIEAMHEADPENVQALLATIHTSLVKPFMAKGGAA